MRRTSEQLEAAILAEAKGLIAELVAWERQAGAPKLSQMEEKVLVVRQQLGQRLLKAMIEDQEARQPTQAPPCPTCGGEMRYKGHKGSDIETRLGGIKVERGYYYCTACESGLFPPR
jgi:hypothetical protein